MIKILVVSHTAPPVSVHSFTLVAITPSLLNLGNILCQRSSNISNTTAFRVWFSSKFHAIRRAEKVEKGLKCMPEVHRKGRGTYWYCWKKNRHLFDKRKIVFHTVAEFVPSTVVRGTFLSLDHMIGWSYSVLSCRPQVKLKQFGN